MITERMRQKTDEARRFAARAPERRREAIEDYIREGEKLSKELSSHIFSPRTASGGGDYIDLVGAKESVGNSLEMAELLMREVLAEEPQGEIDVNAEGVTAPFDIEIDVAASCRRLALKTARETIFMSRPDRLQQGYMQFLETIEPHVPEVSVLKEAGADPDLARVPEQKFTRLLDYLVGLEPKKLSELEDEDIKELEDLWEEPNDAETGTPGEEPSDTVDVPDDAHVDESVDIPRDADGYPLPEDSDLTTPARGDEEFDGEGAATRNSHRASPGRASPRKNRSRKSRKAASRNTGKAKATKGKAAKGRVRVSSVYIASAPPELSDYGVDPRAVEGTVQKVAETTREGGRATYWLDHDGMLLGMGRPDALPLVQRTAKQAADRKTSDMRCLVKNPPDELRRYAIEPSDVMDELQTVDSVTFEDGDTEPTVWIEHEDSLIGFDPLDVELLEVVPEEATEVVDGFSDAANPDDARDTVDDADDAEDDIDEDEEEKRQSRRSSRRTVAGFWQEIDAQLERISSASSADEVIDILNDSDASPEVAADFSALGAGDAFFAGSGGDNQLSSALREAGWQYVWRESSFYYVVQAPDGSMLTYIEGDVYKGDVVNESDSRSSSRSAGRSSRRRRAVKDESEVSGLHSSGEAPEPERSYGEWFVEEAEKSRPEPRGPNRRLPSDVPGHSSPREMLTARRVRAALRREGIDVRLEDVPTLVRAVASSTRKRPVEARSKRALNRQALSSTTLSAESLSSNKTQTDNLEDAVRMLSVETKRLNHSMSMLSKTQWGTYMSLCEKCGLEGEVSENFCKGFAVVEECPGSRNTRGASLKSRNK